MLEVIGAIFVTIAALYLIGSCLYLPLMAAAFSGLKSNIIGIVVGVLFAAGFIAGWWFIVGIHIHMSFG